MLKNVPSISPSEIWHQFWQVNFVGSRQPIVFTNLDVRPGWSFKRAYLCIAPGKQADRSPRHSLRSLGNCAETPKLVHQFACRTSARSNYQALLLRQAEGIGIGFMNIEIDRFA